MLLRIHHETRLAYTKPVTETIFEVRMAPQSDEDQTSLGYLLKIAPVAPVTSYRDGFGNRVDLFNIAVPYQELTVQATSYIRTHRRSGVARITGVPWPNETPISVEALEFLHASPLVGRGPALDAFVASLPPPESTLLGVIRQMKNAVSSRLVYERKVTSERTPVGEALELGRGVCQDFVHLFLGACRGIGLPARYVSGYVHEPGEVATHAWSQVWAGERVGWVDVDPTHRVFPAEGHVVTAVGRDYSDVPPNRGLWKGRAKEEITVTVKVEPLDRVPPQWAEWSTRPTPTARVSGNGPAAPARRRVRALYPDQIALPSGFRQQQGQQQQWA